MSANRTVHAVRYDSPRHDFDEQLWPINAMLFIFACFVGAVVVTAGLRHERFVNPLQDANLATNAWVHLGFVVLAVLILLGGALSLRHRVATRRMQLAVLLALLVQFVYFMALYLLPGPAVAVAPHESEKLASEHERVVIPDYGPTAASFIPESITQPIETPPTPQTPETRTTTQAKQSLGHTGSSGQPASSAQHQPLQSDMAKVAVASTHASQQPGGVLSRTERADRTMPNSQATAPSPAVTENRTSQQLTAMSTPREQRVPDARLERRDTNLPASQTTPTQPTAQMQLQREPTRTPEATRIASTTPRQTPTTDRTAPAAEQPRLDSTAATQNDPSRQPEARSTAVASRTTNNTTALSRSQTASPNSSASVAVTQPAASRATNTSRPEAARLASQPMNRTANNSVALGAEATATAPSAAVRSDAAGTQVEAVASSRREATGASSLSARPSASNPSSSARADVPALAMQRQQQSNTPSPGEGSSPTRMARTSTTSGGAQTRAEAPAMASTAATSPANAGPSGGIEAATASGVPSRTASTPGTGISRSASSSGPGSTAGQGSIAANISKQAGGSSGQPTLGRSGGSAPRAGQTQSGLDTQAVADAAGPAGGGMKAPADGIAGLAPQGGSGNTRSQSFAANVGEKSAMGGPAGTASAGTDLAANTSLARAGGQGQPQVGTGKGNVATAARGTRDGVGLSTAADAPDGGTAGQVAGPDGPTARSIARAGQEGSPGGAIGRGSQQSGPTGMASVTGTAGGPQRASEGTAGPVVAQGGMGPLQRSMAEGLPSGLAAADDPGPTVGENVAAGPGGNIGPAASQASRGQTNSLIVKSQAELGPGGLTRQQGELGLPSRAARADSDMLQPNPNRFELNRAIASVSLDTKVGDLPAAAFEKRERRDSIVAPAGGDKRTEQAVEAGLDFLARHQSADGRWTLHEFTKGKEYRLPAAESRMPQEVGVMHSDTAATGLALLAFLGAGYVHQPGKFKDKYKDVVAGGLNFLLENQKRNGDLYSAHPAMLKNYAWLYSHGIAAIALCEAYGMTRDPKLRDPAQRALDFIVAAQSPEGGWRYFPGFRSDTSVSGWQVMALKSGQLAGLSVPQECFDRVGRWLDYAHPRGDASKYIYLPNSQFQHQNSPSTTMTAEGLLMRLYLGWSPRSPDLLRGADYLMENLPSTREQYRNSYYWYYATNLMIHVKGKRWETWNDRLKTLLLDSQETKGPLRGSWDPLASPPDRWGTVAGRIYVTTMHLLMLEVYYRTLPLYGEQVAGQQ